MNRVHLVVRGRVQGVWFRASTRDQAIQLGLSGWVRNRSDGSVECLAEGPESATAAFVAWCERGPPMATVHHLEITTSEAQGLPEGFIVRSTL